MKTIQTWQKEQKDNENQFILSRKMRILIIIMAFLMSIVILIGWLDIIFNFLEWTKAGTKTVPSKLEITIILTIFTIILIPIWIYIKNNWNKIFSI